MTNTNLDELIAAERAKANARIARLKRQAESDRRKVDARVVALFKEHKPDLYARLESEARAALAAEKAGRSRKSKAAAATRTAKAVFEAADTPEHSEEVSQSWNR